MTVHLPSSPEKGQHSHTSLGAGCMMYYVLAHIPHVRCNPFCVYKANQRLSPQVTIIFLFFLLFLSFFCLFFLLSFFRSLLGLIGEGMLRCACEKHWNACHTESAINTREKLPCVNLSATAVKRNAVQGGHGPFSPWINEKGICCKAHTDCMCSHWKIIAILLTKQNKM